MSETINILQTEINETPDNGADDKYVVAFTDLLEKSRKARGGGGGYRDVLSEENYETEIQMIDNLIEEAGKVESISNSAKKTNSQIIPLAVHKAMAKTRFPFFWLESDNIKPETLDIINGAFYDLVEKSDLIEVYENKSGGMKRAFEVGNSLLKYQINQKTNLPHFIDEDFLKFFPYEFATEMRTSSGERACDKCVITFTYSWDIAVHIFEEYDLKNKATVGRIPMIEDLEKNAYTEIQKQEMEERIIEIAIGFDITDKDNPVELMFAGASSAPLYLKKGKEGKKPYAWFKGKKAEREPFIPLINLKCITKSKGFTSLGWGQLFYKPALSERTNKNSGLVYMDNNVNAKKVLGVGNMNAVDWNKRSQIADKYLAQGKNGVIPISLQKDEKISLTTLSSEPLTGEFERVTGVIEKDILRWFNIDSNITDKQKTLGALELEEESQDIILRQIARNNVREIKFALELIINFLENDVILEDDRKLNVNKEINGRKINNMKIGKITIGEFAEIFQKKDITVRVQGETGVKASDTLRRARIEKQINKLLATNPRNPAIARLSKELAELDGLSLSDKEAQAIIGQDQQDQQGQGGQQQTSPQQQLSLTQPL